MSKPDYKFRMKYLERIIRDYHKLDKKSKGKVLQEAQKITGYNKKYLVFLFNCPFTADKAKSCKITGRGRKKVYDYTIKPVIKDIWQTANYPWSVRLKEIIKDWLPYIKERYNLSEHCLNAVLNISPSAIDRLLKKDKISIKKRIYAKTKPGSLLKRQIPISVTFDKDIGPGHLEIDLVAHCGNSGFGDFLYTLNCTDIYSGWDESVCLKDKSEESVKEALIEVGKSLPFKILSLNSDNGSEFINWHLLRYCKQESIELTRSRPYKKDDNAHIEQKNWTNVRKILAWDRYESLESLKAINDLYRKELRLFINLFLPSVKLIKAVRVGGRIKKYYDKPKTHYQRLAQFYPDHPKVKELKETKESLNPFNLSQEIENKVKKIYEGRANKSRENIANGKEEIIEKIEKMLKKEVIYG